MSRFASRLSAVSVALTLVLSHAALMSSAAQATVTDTNVTTSTSQTFDDGNIATVSFANGAFASASFNGVTNLNYLVTANNNSSVTVTFSSPVSDLQLSYGWIDTGDFSKVSTNVSGPGGLDLTDSSIVTSHVLDSCPPASDCAGMASLTATGLIQAPNTTPAVRYNGKLQLEFATPITSITVLGPADRTQPGGNAFGFSIPVVTHTVTFNSNFGSPATTTQTKGVPSALDANTFSRTGYTFDGWNDQQNGQGTDYTDGQSYDFTADVTLFAQWTSLSAARTVTFSPNGGSGTMAEQSYEGTANLSPNTLTREGYTFAGWNTEQDGNGTAYADGASFDFSSDETLFAQWSLNSVPPTNASLEDLVNTGLSWLGPVGTAGALVSFGAPFFLLSSRFRKVRAFGGIVLHKSAHLTISTPATMFDRLRRHK